MRRTSLVFLATLLSFSAHGASITETFNSSEKNNTLTTTAADGVWDLTAGTLHVPHTVDRDGGAPSEDDVMHLGQGTDGPFSLSTYSTFDSLPGTPNTIDLPTTRTYQFTTFNLENGYTLKPVGSAPLEIKVQGAVLIEGTIDLRGGDGEDVNTTLTTIPSGGTAAAGGGAGGNGGQGSTASNGSDGTPTNSDADGMGLGGGASASAVLGDGSGGGGGGGHANLPASHNGENGGVGGGTGGLGGPQFGFTDPYVTEFVGGSGGGGGGGYNLGAVNAQSSGGAGGGGGGALRLMAASIEVAAVTGKILATGGSGGSQANADTHAGAGGGGAGGTVVLFSREDIVIDGELYATGGMRGVGGHGGDGGNGAIGRTRLENGNGNGYTGGITVEPLPNVAFGTTYFSTQSVVVESKSYDTGTNEPAYLSFTPTETLNSGTLTYEIAGSSDDFGSDDTGYLPVAQLSDIDGKRYFKFRVTLQAGNRTSSPEVSQIRVAFFDQAFAFRFASCARTSFPRDRASIVEIIGIAFLFLIPLLFRPIRRKFSH